MLSWRTQKKDRKSVINVFAWQYLFWSKVETFWSLYIHICQKSTFDGRPLAMHLDVRGLNNHNPIAAMGCFLCKYSPVLWWFFHTTLHHLFTIHMTILSPLIMVLSPMMCVCFFQVLRTFLSRSLCTLPDLVFDTFQHLFFVPVILILTSY